MGVSLNTAAPAYRNPALTVGPVGFLLHEDEVMKALKTKLKKIYDSAYVDWSYPPRFVDKWEEAGIKKIVEVLGEDYKPENNAWKDASIPLPKGGEISGSIPMPVKVVETCPYLEGLLKKGKTADSIPDEKLKGL